MKDHIGIDQLTSLILRQRPPKPYKLLKFFISFVTTVKSRHAPTIWIKEAEMKSLYLPILKSITEIMKHFKSLYGFGGSGLKIRDVRLYGFWATFQGP